MEDQQQLLTGGKYLGSFNLGVPFAIQAPMGFLHFPGEQGGARGGQGKGRDAWFLSLISARLALASEPLHPGVGALVAMASGRQ